MKEGFFFFSAKSRRYHIPDMRHPVCRDPAWTNVPLRINYVKKKVF